MTLYSIFTIWLFFTVICFFVAPKIGFASFLIYTIVVPTVVLNIGMKIGVTMLEIIAFIGFYVYIKSRHGTINFEPLKPFFLYFGLTLLLMPFQKHVPYSNMFSEWFRNVVHYTFLPLIMWNLMIYDKKYINIFQNAILVCIIVSVGYGFYLTYLGGGLNPYQMLMLSLYGDANHDWESFYSVGDARLFGHLSSVFRHPMNFAFFLGCALVYLYYTKDYCNKFFIYVVLICTGIMAIFCGVRSVLAAMIITFIYYFLRCKNYKIMLSFILLAIIGTFIIEQFPKLNDYIESVSGTSEKIQGSSTDMRLAQLEGAIMEGMKSPIVGLGYGWTGFYQSCYGIHPVCLAFESLLFMVICNFGVAGFIIWGVLTNKYFNYFKGIPIANDIVIKSLFIFYISYSLVTGDYGYLRYFLLFHIMLLAHNIENIKSYKTYFF